MWQATRKAAELIKLVTYCDNVLINHANGQRSQIIEDTVEPNCLPEKLISKHAPLTLYMRQTIYMRHEIYRPTGD